MDHAETLSRLKLLYDQVHQTDERLEHLPASMPFHVHPQSLNYGKDLVRIQGEYNRLAASAQDQGILTPAELEAEGLPLQFDETEAKARS